MCVNKTDGVTMQAAMATALDLTRSRRRGHSSRRNQPCCFHRVLRRSQTYLRHGRPGDRGVSFHRSRSHTRLFLDLASHESASRGLRAFVVLAIFGGTQQAKLSQSCPTSKEQHERLVEGTTVYRS